jgi:hypothetical protein
LNIEYPTSAIVDMPELFFDRIMLSDGALREDHIGDLFHPAGTIALRYGGKMLVMSVSDYRVWLKAALSSAGMKDFHEQPTVLSLFQQGDIATLLVATRADADGVLFERGLGTFGLIRENDAWKILSLAFEISESSPRA